LDFLLDYWIGLDFFSSIQSNNSTKIQQKIQKSNFFGFSELDLVGCSIIHPIQKKVDFLILVKSKVSFKVKIFVFVPRLDFCYGSKPKNSVSDAKWLKTRHYGN
jgi:hypothetical protein